jgi:hypothetical protein
VNASQDHINGIPFDLRRAKPYSSYHRKREDIVSLVLYPGRGRNQKTPTPGLHCVLGMKMNSSVGRSRHMPVIVISWDSSVVSQVNSFSRDHIACTQSGVATVPGDRVPGGMIPYKGVIPAVEQPQFLNQAFPNATCSSAIGSDVCERRPLRGSRIQW